MIEVMREKPDEGKAIEWDLRQIRCCLNELAFKIFIFLKKLKNIYKIK